MAIRDSQRELAATCRESLLEGHERHGKLVREAAIDMIAFQEDPGQNNIDEDDSAFGFIQSLPLQTSK